LAIAIWSARFETGIELVDAQHQALFEAVNRLAASFGAGSTADQARESLAFLADWLKHHIHGSDMAYVRFVKDKNRE
jgi:hemerythrin